MATIERPKANEVATMPALPSHPVATATPQPNNQHAGANHFSNGFFEKFHDESFLLYREQF
jgi:hypothetical protein